MDKAMMRALEADGEKLAAMTGEDQEPAFLADCPECEGTGLRDTGGVYPWGEYISVPCDCDDREEARAARKQEDGDG